MSPWGKTVHHQAVADKIFLPLMRPVLSSLSSRGSLIWCVSAAPKMQKQLLSFPHPGRPLTATRLAERDNVLVTDAGCEGHTNYSRGVTAVQIHCLHAQFSSGLLQSELPHFHTV